MNGGSRYPFIDRLLSAIAMVIAVVVWIGVFVLIVRILTAFWRFIEPEITFIGLVIMIPLTLFVLYWGIGLTTDIIRYIKDRRAAANIRKEQQNDEDVSDRY